MKFEAKNLSSVAFHALTCAEVSVSIQCFDWGKMAAEGFPVARIDEYAKPCEPAIHVLRSVQRTGVWIGEARWFLSLLQGLTLISLK